MLKKYFLWVGLSVWGLAGCSRSERASETADARTASNPAPPIAPVSPPVAGAASPAPAATGVPRAAAGGETTRLLALLEAPRRRSSTTLAAAADDDADDEPNGPRTAAASDSAGLGELRTFLQNGLPTAQVFSVRPGRDTLLVAAQGTQLLVAADAWDVPPGSGPIMVKIQEFYQLSDIVLAGLTTTAGPDLLETGGMVHLEATANGQPARLRPNAAVHLRLPTTRRQDGMQLFVSPGPSSSANPGAGPARGFDWQLPPPSGLAASRPPVRQAAWRASTRRTGRRRWFTSRRARSAHPQYNARYLEVPQYATSQTRALKTMARRIAYPTTTQLRLRKALRTGRRVSSWEVSELQQASARYGERVLRVVHASFRVDTLGKMYRLAVAPGTDNELGTAVLAALGRLGTWQPALMPRLPALDSLTTVAAFGQVTAYFSASDHVYVADSVSWSRPATRALRDSITKVRLASVRAQQQNYYASLTPRQRRVLDSTVQANRVAERARLYQQLGKNGSVAANQNLLYYELSAQSLGWINCDRFLNAGPRIEFVVNAELRNTIVTLIFRDIRAVLEAHDSGSRTTFSSVPTGQAATVVALRREKGVTYLARHEVVLDAKGLDKLTFHPVTPDELRTELASLH